jgi:hypothetical protein
LRIEGLGLGHGGHLLLAGPQHITGGFADVVIDPPERWR